MRLMKRLTVAASVLGVAVAGTIGSSGPAGAADSGQAASWGPVVNLSAREPSWNLLPTSAAIDSNGNTLAVWVHTDGSRSALTAASRRAGHRWRTPVAVPGSRGAADAKVAFDGHGDAVVVWMDARRLRATRRNADGSWSRPVTVYRSPEDMEARSPNSVALAVNENGRAVTAIGSMVAIGRPDGTWSRSRDLFRLRKARRDTSNVVVPSGPTSSSGDTNISIDRWGRATVALREGGWFGRVFAAYKDPGRPWTTPRALTKLEFEPKVQIAVRRDGEVAVAWQTWVRYSSAFRIARKTREGTWVRTEPYIHGMGNVGKLRMAMDGAGVVTVAWLGSRGGLWRVEHSPETGWAAKVRVTPAGTGGDEYGLVANEAGDVVIASTAAPGRHSVWALRRSPAGVWDGRPTTVSQGRGETRGPALAVGPTGQAVVVWTFQPAGSTQSRVQAATISG